MVEIRALTSKPNLTLRKGSAQHWSFGATGMPGSEVWQRLVTAHGSGRCLVIGVPPEGLLAAVRGSVAGLTVLTWAIPDAERIADEAPEAQVLCGEVSDLPAGLAPFDSIVCADLATVLSLESESRPWQGLLAEVRGLLAPHGVLLLAIENDLAPHRLAASHNPRSESSDADWAPVATWDGSRPRSLDQLATLGAGSLWALAPGWPDVRVAWRVGEGGDAAPALALRAAVWPLRGPDPAWLLSSLAMAGRLDEAASAWLAVIGAPADLPAVLVDGPVRLDLEARGRSLLGVFAAACAAHDLPAIRELLAGWAAQVQARPDAVPDLGAWLEDEGRYVPLLTTAGGHGGAWSGLVSLVLWLRGRAWRHPWPATTSDDDLLAVLGAMAGLGDPPSSAREELAVGLPVSADPFAALDRQQLVAAIDRNNETIRTLRSRLSWTEKQYLSAKAIERAKARSARARRLVGRAKRSAAAAARRARGR